MFALGVGIYVEHSVARLITFYAIFKDVCDLIRRISTGLLGIVGIVLERRGVEAQRHLAVGYGKYDIVLRAELYIGSLGEERLRCGAINTILIYARANLHCPIEYATVRVKEGQRGARDRAQTEVVAGIELERGNVTLAALQFATEDRAHIGHVVLLGHQHDGTRDSLRFIDRKFALVVALEFSLNARTVGINDVGHYLRVELEDVELIFERIGCYRNGRFRSGAGVSRGNGDAVGIVLADKQEIARGAVGRIAVIVDIRIETALLVVNGNKVAVGRRPLHLIRQKSPYTATVVGGDDFLQTHIGTQSVEVTDGKLIAVARNAVVF